MAWKSSPVWFFTWLGLSFCQVLPTLASVFFVRSLAESLAEQDASRHILLLVSALVGVLWLGELLRSLSNFVTTLQSEFMQAHLHELVHQKAMDVDLQFYDLPDKFDHLHRAQAEAFYRPALLIQNSGALIQQLFLLFGMLLVLAQYGLMVPTALLAGCLPSGCLFLVSSSLQKRWKSISTPLERRARYYCHLLTARESAAEVRALCLGPTLRDSYEKTRKQIFAGNVRVAKFQLALECVSATFPLAAVGTIVAWILSRTEWNSIRFAEFTVLILAIVHSGRAMHAISQQLGRLYTNLVFLGNLMQYLGLQCQITTHRSPAPVESKIAPGYRFTDVSFRYPGSNRDTLSKLNMAFPAGKTVAIVGANGSGKSTLIKLLLRLYDPTEGQITRDDIDIRLLDLPALRHSSAVLLQNPIHFCETLRRNVEWGLPNEMVSDAQFRHAANAAFLGEIINELPEGEHQLLGKWFQGGVELSQGQWQRVGMSRAVVRDSQLLILDEPTSAMDPWTEGKWVGNLSTLTAGRTTLIITHKLSTAMHADVIYVMEHGQIIESGTHLELLEAGNMYSQAWYQQQSS